MFGFGKGENPKDKETNREEVNAWRLYIPGAMSNTFGTTDPKKINQIWHKYMPEVTNAILNTNKIAENINNNVVQNSKNQVAINDNINVKHDEVMEELKTLKLQNQELQKKYDAVLERMDKLLAREEGKGR